MPIQPSVNIHVEPGTKMAEYWKPYKLWAGDLWKCEGCGHLTISGVPHQPLSEHYMPTFEKYIEHFKPKTQINDCY